MARLFDDVSTEYLSYAGAVWTGWPMTMCAWFYADDDSIFQTVMSLGRSSTDSPFKRIAIDGTGANEVWASERDNADAIGNAKSTSGFTANTWHHAAAVFTNASSRTAYIDGGSAGSEATALTAQTLDRTAIGVLLRTGTAFPFSGRIAEAAIWYVALDADDIASLAAGVCPLLVRPDDLAAYWPLGGMWNDANVGNAANSDFDIFGRNHMDPQNTPSVAAHPPGIIYPFAGIQITAATPAGVAGSPWHYYKQLSGAV